MSSWKREERKPELLPPAEVITAFVSGLQSLFVPSAIIFNIYLLLWKNASLQKWAVLFVFIVVARILLCCLKLSCNWFEKCTLKKEKTLDVKGLYWRVEEYKDYLLLRKGMLMLCSFIAIFALCYTTENFAEEWEKLIQCLLFYLLQFCIIFLPRGFTETTKDYFSLTSEYLQYKHDQPVVTASWIYPIFLIAVIFGTYEKLASALFIPYFFTVLLSCFLDFLALFGDEKFMEGIVEQDKILFANQYYWKRGKLRMIEAFDEVLELPILECPICLFDYNNDKCPRILPNCGHTVCEPCVQNLLSIVKHRFACPFCTKPSDGTRLHHYPKNYALRDVVQELRKNRKKSKSN